MLLGRVLSPSIAHDSFGKCSLHIERFPRDVQGTLVSPLPCQPQARESGQPEHLPQHHCPGTQLSPFTPSKYFGISQTSQNWGKNIILGGGKGQTQLCFPLDTQLWRSKVSYAGTSCCLGNAGGHSGTQVGTGGEIAGTLGSL